MLAVTTLVLLAAAQAQATARYDQSPGGAPDSAVMFPKVEGTNLEGRHFRLPKDFEGELNVVLVAFKREQQKDVDTWTPSLKKLASRHAGLRIYELPTLSRSYRLMRPFIDGGMSRGIPDRSTREATITLYIDKSPFKKALRISTENAICVLLVSRDGKVLWRGEGDFEENAAASLEAAIIGG